MARLLIRHGEPYIILLVRTIIESEGNAAALIEPVISAVSSVMVFHPEWANRGLAWIEAFDGVPLMPLLQSIAAAKGVETVKKTRAANRPALRRESCRGQVRG